MDQGDRFNQKNHDLNYDDLVERVIEEINDFSGFDLISGNRFNDLWEEIAYQVQNRKKPQLLCIRILYRDNMSKDYQVFA